MTTTNYDAIHHGRAAHLGYGPPAVVVRESSDAPREVRARPAMPLYAAIPRACSG